MFSRPRDTELMHCERKADGKLAVSARSREQTLYRENSSSPPRFTNLPFCAVRLTHKLDALTLVAGMNHPGSHGNGMP